MQPEFSINPQLDVPIYRQLVDTIRVAVKKGTLAPLERLPTVQELSERLDVAKGTIKRAYDELEREGIVEKAQGRGTFIRYQPENSGSSKEQAMAAIDGLLLKLEEMGFSPAEINIFLNLKLRERSEQEALVKVALVECNPENMSTMTEQLRAIPGIDLYAFLLEDVEQYPYKLEESFSLIVTSVEHAAYLENVLPKPRRIVRIALRLVPYCMAKIIKLKRGKRVGVLGYSPRFANLLHSTCQMYADDVQLQDAQVFSQVTDMDAYLRDLDAVLLPKQYEKYCSKEAAESLAQFAGKKIICSYEMDEGSFLYLQEKLHRILEEKKI